MYAAQHLAEREIEGTETGLTSRGFLIMAVLTNETIVPGVAIARWYSMRGMFVSFKRVPSGMHQRALLRSQQQEDQKIMKIPARHGRGRYSENRQSALTARAVWGTISQRYLAAVTTASVRR